MEKEKSARVEAARAVMSEACARYNEASAAGAGEDVRGPLREAHRVARFAWIRAKAEAGERQSSHLVLLGLVGEVAGGAR